MKLTQYLLSFAVWTTSSLLIGATSDEETSEHSLLRASKLHLIEPLSATDETFTACASFIKYSDAHCLDGPITDLTFSTHSAKGSHCVASVTNKHYSFKDQYCDLDHNEWHETEYTRSSKCHVKWFEKMLYHEPWHLKFTSDTCTGGYVLKSCTPGPCPNSTATSLMEAETELEANVE